MGAFQSFGQAGGTRAAGPTRVLLVDDHDLTLWGLRQLVESASPAMQVVGTAGSCAELLAHPQLTSGGRGVARPRAARCRCLGCVEQLVRERGKKVVLLTGELNPARHRDAVMRGARGVVLKSQPPEHVLLAIERVQSGEVWLDGSLMAMLLGSVPGIAMPASPAPRDEHAQRIQSLTQKEREVVRLMAQHRGAKNLAIAEELGMSEHTLRNHLTVIYSKLGVQGKLNLYVYALEHGLAGAGAAPSIATQNGGWRPGDPDRRASNTPTGAR